MRAAQRRSERPPPRPRARRDAVYARTAADDETGTACRDQIRRVLEVIGTPARAAVYGDPGGSGLDADRPAMHRLLVHVRRGGRRRVERRSRKVRELAQMVDELTKYGVTLKSITEPFDTANAAGKLTLQMLGVFAEFEHATIVERTRVGMEKKAKGGNFVGGNVPFGFTLDPEKGLVIHEGEALIGRKIFKMYALEKVRDLRARLEDLEAAKRDLEARRERLELPAVDWTKLEEIVRRFEEVMAEGPAPQKKHLLHRLVKKVPVHDRRTVGVWYGLPNPQRFEDWKKWLPGPDSNQRPGG